jgi:hypothetical protein
VAASRIVQPGGAGRGLETHGLYCILQISHTWNCLTYPHVELHFVILIFSFRVHKSILPLFPDIICISFSSSCAKDVCLFHKSPDGVWNPPSLPAKWSRGLFTPGVNQLRRKLTSRLYLLPKLKMRGAVTPLPQYVFIRKAIPPVLPLQFYVPLHVQLWTFKHRYINYDARYSFSASMRCLFALPQSKKK